MFWTECRCHEILDGNASGNIQREVCGWKVVVQAFEEVGAQGVRKADGGRRPQDLPPFKHALSTKTGIPTPLVTTQLHVLGHHRAARNGRGVGRHRKEVPE